MSLIDDLTIGRFVAGRSLLHRTDVRCKLLVLAVLVTAAFALPKPAQLAGLGLLSGILIAMSGVSPRIWWRGLWVFRWLFLFTVLLHTLLSPGHTLWGLEFFSRDGLLHGLTVVMRLSLAVIFSSMLTLTSSAWALAAGIGSLLAPLGRLGLPAQRIAEILFLTLHFIPLLREELIAAGAGRRRQKTISLLRWGISLRDLLTPVILGMVDRADQLAQSLALGKEIITPETAHEQGSLALGFVLIGGAVLWVALLVWLI